MRVRWNAKYIELDKHGGAKITPTIGLRVLPVVEAHGGGFDATLTISSPKTSLGNIIIRTNAKTAQGAIGRVYQASRDLKRKLGGNAHALENAQNV